jgi:hypothetical protein
MLQNEVRLSRQDQLTSHPSCGCSRSSGACLHRLHHPTDPRGGISRASSHTKERMAHAANGRSTGTATGPVSRAPVTRLVDVWRVRRQATAAAEPAGRAGGCGWGVGVPGGRRRPSGAGPYRTGDGLVRIRPLGTTGRRFANLHPAVESLGNHAYYRSAISRKARTSPTGPSAAPALSPRDAWPRAAGDQGG